YSLHPLAGAEARHLLFLEPVLSILTGLGLAELLLAGVESGAAVGWRAVLALLLLGVFAADRGLQVIHLARDDTIYRPLGRSGPALAPEMLRFRDGHGVDHIMSEDWDLSWRLVFASGERIPATHSSLWLGRLLREQPWLHAEHWAVILPGGEAADLAHVRRLLARQASVVPQHVAGRDVYLLSPPADPGKGEP